LRGYNAPRIFARVRKEADVDIFLSVFGALGVGGVIGVFVTQVMTNRREAVVRRTAAHLAE
jgi:hypothetical protein